MQETRRKETLNAALYMIDLYLRTSKFGALHAGRELYSILYRNAVIVIPPYHDNSHTIFCCVRMKSTTHEKGTVCGVMLFFMLTPSCNAFAWLGWFVMTHVCAWYHTKCSCSIACQKCGIRNCFVFRTAMENTDQLIVLRSPTALLLADGNCLWSTTDMHGCHWD